MSVQNQIDRISGEVETQNVLISQIASVLAGKAGGGDGIVPSGTKTITENGTYDVTSFAEAFVNVENEGGGGITPSGTKTITANGTYDVTQYASAFVNVAGGALPAGIEAIDTGTFTLDSNASGYYQISHKLGVAPNFILAFVKSGTVTVENAPAVLFTAQFGIDFVSSDSNYGNGPIFTYGLDNTGSISSNTSRWGDITIHDEELAYLYTPILPFKAGIEYQWIVGKASNLI